MIRVYRISGADYGDAEDIKESMVLSIREYLYSGVLKHPTGQLAGSIRGYIYDSMIYIVSDKKYAEAVDTGRAPHVMTYLLNKTVPIGGTFRRVTMQSIMDGKWRHPGTEGVHYMEHALTEVRTIYPHISIESA